MKHSMLSLLLCCAINHAAAQEPASAADLTDSATASAKAFLETLNESQRQACLFRFDDEQQQKRWSNLPTGIFRRAGVRWGDLNEKQHQALRDMLKAILSESGYQQIIDNMEGDEILREHSGGRRRVVFGRDEYYVSFLGTPSDSDPWALQFGGHHLAINVTIVGNQMTLAPSLTGGQPMDYKLNGKTIRQLAAEEDKAYELITSLEPEQLKQAVLDDYFADMDFGPGREGAQPRNEGINAGMFNEQQQKLFLELVGERMGLLKSVFANHRMERIAKDIDQTWFSWYGPIEKGGAATFRIQGPTILMEYSPQRLGGLATDHIHAMYRDPTNDYGAAFLEKLK